MENPFDAKFSDSRDIDLVKFSLLGNKSALEQLVLRHQPFIYNIAWKMVLSPMDAEDITQDILIKVITNLSKFEGKSEFRTWLYRIVVNHILNFKKCQLENIVNDFDNYFEGLVQMPDADLSEDELLQYEETIRDVSISCTSGMLLCLDREQRMLIVLGDIFSIDHKLGAEIFNISTDNYRQRLTRARKELYNWMNNKCGLINRDNPCRCPKKTKSFIAQGYVNPDSLVFNANYDKKMSDILTINYSEKCETIDELHRQIFRESPFRKSIKSQTIIDEIVNDKIIKEIYGF